MSDVIVSVDAAEDVRPVELPAEPLEQDSPAAWI
jgi:hypothetical protein